MLIRVIYVSQATQPFDTSNLDALLALSRRNNETLGITGMLLYHEGDFVQILEGEEAAVREIYGRIVRDSRHARIILIDDSPVSEREFGDWSMGFVRLDDSEIPPGYVDFFNREIDPSSLAGRALEALEFLRSARSEAR